MRRSTSTIALGIALTTLSVSAFAAGMGDMMNPSKWMGGSDDNDRRGDYRRGDYPPPGYYSGAYGPGYGAAPGYGAPGGYPSAAPGYGAVPPAGPVPGYDSGYGPGYGQGPMPQGPTPGYGYGGYGPNQGYGPGYGYGPDYGYGPGYDEREGDGGGFNPMKMMPNPMQMFGGDKD